MQGERTSGKKVVRQARRTRSVSAGLLPEDKRRVLLACASTLDQGVCAFALTHAIFARNSIKMW